MPLCNGYEGGAKHYSWRRYDAEHLSMRPRTAMDTQPDRAWHSNAPSPNGVPSPNRARSQGARSTSADEACADGIVGMRMTSQMTVWLSDDNLPMLMAPTSPEVAFVASPESKTISARSPNRGFAYRRFVGKPHVSPAPATSPKRGKGLGPLSPRPLTDAAPPKWVCAICLRSNWAHAQLASLPRCSHTFHEECVSRWLTRAGVCPCCRAEV